MKRLVLVTCAGLLVGFGGRTVWERAPQVADLEPRYERIGGTLAAHVSGPAAKSAVLILSPADVLTCEDLGRQVRELVHGTLAPAGIPLDVWYFDDDDGTVPMFVESERLAVRRISEVDIDEILGESRPSPALLVIDAQGRYEGVAYLNRTRWVRTESFGRLLRTEGILGHAAGDATQTREEDG